MSEREKKRKSLSLSQKLDIIRKIEANPQQRKAVIAEELGIPFSTLCNIWRDRQRYLNNVASGTEDLSRKRSRTAKLETVDENLLKWFSDSSRLRRTIASPHTSIQRWGISLNDYVSVDNHVPTTEPATLSASATSTSASNVAGAGATDSSEEDESSEKEAETVSVCEVLGYVRQINLYCLQAGCGDAVTKSVHVFTDLLMKHIVNARHQTQITDFFMSTSSDNLNCREDKDSEGFKTSGGEDGDDRSEGGKAGNTETGGNCEKEKASETEEREMKEKSGGRMRGTRTKRQK
ncbi:hypothetical protein ACOMHN_020945 [Nucella lapillus]